MSCASHLARRGLSNGRRRGLSHRCSFRAPAANPGPRVLVESYFPFAEPMGICRGQAEDRLQPTYLHPSRLPGGAEPFQGRLMASLPMGAPLTLQNRRLGWTHPCLGDSGCSDSLRKGKNNKLQTKMKKTNKRLRKGNDLHQCRGELGFVVCGVMQLDAVCSKPEQHIVAVWCHVTN